MLVQAVAAVTVAVAASMTPSQAAAPTAVPDDFVITLERTECFGECPVYAITIDAVGHLTYEGKMHVRVEGRQEDRIEASRVAALFKTVERIGFFELRDRYRTIRNPDGSETSVTDLPTTIVTVTRGGRSKRVEDYLGAPAGLRTLEQQLDDIARTTRWIRIDESTVQQWRRDGRSPAAEERDELLRKALMHDEVAVVKALLQIGANPNAAYYGTHTPPLMMAQSAEAARALIEGGAVPTIRNDNGDTPLSRSVYGAPEIAAVLLGAGVPADERDADGRTPLFDAACLGNLDMVRLLLAAGADPGVRLDGTTAMACAQLGRQRARARTPSPHGGEPPFTEDFNGVIALLEQALAKRIRR